MKNYAFTTMYITATLHTFKRQLKTYMFHFGCRRTEGTFTIAQRCCGVYRDTKLPTYLLTYLYSTKVGIGTALI